MKPSERRGGACLVCVIVGQLSPRQVPAKTFNPVPRSNLVVHADPGHDPCAPARRTTKMPRLPHWATTSPAMQVPLTGCWGTLTGRSLPFSGCVKPSVCSSSHNKQQQLRPRSFCPGQRRGKLPESVRSSESRQYEELISKGRLVPPPSPSSPGTRLLRSFQGMTLIPKGLVLPVALQHSLAPSFACYGSHRQCSSSSSQPRRRLAS